jgi:hypothetical protein
VHHRTVGERRAIPIRCGSTLRARTTLSGVISTQTGAKGTFRVSWTERVFGDSTGKAAGRDPRPG